MLDNFSAHKGEKVRRWAADTNVELAYTPFYASSLNRIEAQFRALRYFTLAGTYHPDHATQVRLIRRAATSPGATATPTTHAYARSSTRPTSPDAPLAPSAPERLVPCGSPAVREAPAQRSTTSGSTRGAAAQPAARRIVCASRDAARTNTAGLPSGDSTVTVRPPR